MSSDGQIWPEMSGDELGAWRSRLGWSQREAARRLGVSLPAYQEWERGARFRDGRPALIDRRTALACLALEAGLDQRGAP